DRGALPFPPRRTRPAAARDAARPVRADRDPARPHAAGRPRAAHRAGRAPRRAGAAHRAAGAGPVRRGGGGGARVGSPPMAELTGLRASIVKAESLAQVARELGLGELLLLGRGEERTGGREKQSLLADALEAVVASVYLSRGLQSALEVLDRLLAPLFEAAT